MEHLREKEAAVLDYVARHPSVSQRSIAKTTGISLGLINVILNRFVKTGYIKASRLNKKRLEYILTPEGFMETARRSYNFMTSTVRNYNRIYSQLGTLLAELQGAGHTYFSIYGDGELKSLVEYVFKSTLNTEVAILGNDHLDSPGAVILNVTPDTYPGDRYGRVINVLERLRRVG